MDRRQSEFRVQTVCLLILTIVAVGAALYWLKPVLIPFVLAFFFTTCLGPVIDAQMKYLRLPRPIAYVLTAVFGVMIFVLLWVLVSATANQITASAPVYHEEVKQLLTQCAEMLPADQLGMRTEELIQSIQQSLQDGVKGVLAGTFKALVGVLSTGVLVAVFMLFMTMGRTAPPSQRQIFRGEMEQQIRRYILAKLVVSVVTALLVGTVLWLVGVQFAFVFTVFVFLLNFIPSIGSIIATLLPLPVVLVAPELSPLSKVLAIAIPGSIQITIGNIIEPRIFGQSLNLHPIAILMSLIFFGMIWGLVGMFLAAPVASVLKIVLEKGEMTAPLAALLRGDTEALSDYAKEPDDATQRTSEPSQTGR